MTNSPNMRAIFLPPNAPPLPRHASRSKSQDERSGSHVANVPLRHFSDDESYSSSSSSEPHVRFADEKKFSTFKNIISPRRHRRTMSKEILIGKADHTLKMEQALKELYGEFGGVAAIENFVEKPRRSKSVVTKRELILLDEDLDLKNLDTLFGN
ncbi:hypothetical protein HK096_003744 [Nowakowskiella sp. JEL0078]|nr:hypothetical protein HK096_003744 [Nowakowskiella sp. JEL0078]